MAHRSAAILLAAALGFSGAASGAASHVTAVYPSSAAIPANLLRITLVFDRKPAPDIRRRVKLQGSSAQTSGSPFLSPELRSPDGRTVTLLLDPARVKAGTAANLALGRVLREGDDVTLTLDGQAVRAWHVGRPLDQGLDAGRWRLATVPVASSTAPLRMDLGDPVDGLDGDLIAIAGPDGQRVQGRARLLPGEAAWMFQPAAPWARGNYVVRVHDELEDPCGNRVGAPFETRAHATGSSAPPAFMVP